MSAASSSWSPDLAAGNLLVVATARCDSDEKRAVEG
jgi:hypothetical protein